MFEDSTNFSSPASILSFPSVRYIRTSKNNTNNCTLDYFSVTENVYTETLKVFNIYPLMEKYSSTVLFSLFDGLVLEYEQFRIFFFFFGYVPAAFLQDLFFESPNNEKDTRIGESLFEVNSCRENSLLDIPVDLTHFLKEKLPIHGTEEKSNCLGKKLFFFLQK